MKRFVTFLAALALLLGAMREAKSGSVWDAVADFNQTGTNPLGGNPWAYGSESTLGGAFTPVVSYENVNVSYGSFFAYFWGIYPSGVGGGGPPLVAKNNGGTITLPAPIPVVWPSNVLMLAPGGIYSQGFPASPEFTVVQWTAPATGSYSLSGTYTNLEASTADVHVMLNGTSIYSDSFNGSTGPNSHPFSATNLSISQDQTIQFIVGTNGSPVDYNDPTGLSARITFSSVPEPSALTHLGIGALVLLGCGWRRRRLAIAC